MTMILQQFPPRRDVFESQRQNYRQREPTSCRSDKECDVLPETLLYGISDFRSCSSQTCGPVAYPGTPNPIQTPSKMIKRQRLRLCPLPAPWKTAGVTATPLLYLRLKPHPPPPHHPAPIYSSANYPQLYFPLRSWFLHALSG